MEARPNILILVWDAARAENFSVLGYDKPTTPNLERYAKELALYRRCICPATWTLPSIASLFASVYPSTHRLVIDGDQLDLRFRTMAEILGEAGYFTAKVTGEVPYVSDFTGLDRGFALNHAEQESDLGRVFRLWRREGSAKEEPETEGSAARTGEDPEAFARNVAADLEARASLKARLRYWMTGYVDSGADACFERIRALWKEHAGRPRFVYSHLMETHAEYRPPHRYRKRFVPAHLRGRNFAAINQRPNPHAVGLADLTAEDFQILTGLYDGCIAYLDEKLGELFDDLSRGPDWDDTLVIVTADHGDCLGRHGILGHQFVCYDELLRIPWIVKWPKSVGLTGERDELIQTVDLLPTLCGLLGLEAPAQCEGIDWLRDRREVAYAELLKPFARTAAKQGLHEMAPQYRRAVLAVRDRAHKLIAYSNGAPEELYDLEADPREANNLLAADPATWSSATAAAEARLRSALDERRPRWKEAADEIDRRVFSDDASADLSPKVEAQLRALGYLD